MFAMLHSQHLVIKFFIFLLFLTKVFASDVCYWKSDISCKLSCSDEGNIADVINWIEKKWSEQPQCHSDGIALIMSTINYPNQTGMLEANWFEPMVKVNYLEFGVMDGVNGIDENAFNSEAFKSVKQLVFTKMDQKMLKKGAFNGLESLQILKIKGAYEFRDVDMGILDGLNVNLKEFTIERNGSYEAMRLDGERYKYGNHDSRSTFHIDVFTGSSQKSNLEYVKIRYHLQQLYKESFLSLEKIKYLDLSFCGIQSIDKETFTSIVGTVKVINLMNNPFEHLPSGMLDLMTMSYGTYIFMGWDYNEYDCMSLPVNIVLKVKVIYTFNPEPFDVLEKRCNKFLGK